MSKKNIIITILGILFVSLSLFAGLTLLNNDNKAKEETERFKDISGLINEEQITSNKELNIYFITKNATLSVSEEVQNLVAEMKSENFQKNNPRFLFREIYYDDDPENFEDLMTKYGLMNFPVFVITDKEGKVSYISDANPMDIVKVLDL